MAMRLYSKAAPYVGVILLIATLGLTQTPVPPNKPDAHQTTTQASATGVSARPATRPTAAASSASGNELEQLNHWKPGHARASRNMSGEDPLYEGKDQTASKPALRSHDVVQYK